MWRVGVIYVWWVWPTVPFWRPFSITFVFWTACSVRCPEFGGCPLLGSFKYTVLMVNSIGTSLFVRCMEVDCFWEGLLTEILLYYNTWWGVAIYIVNSILENKRQWIFLPISFTKCFTNKNNLITTVRIYIKTKKKKTTGTRLGWCLSLETTLKTNSTLNTKQLLCNTYMYMYTVLVPKCMCGNSKPTFNIFPHYFV